MAAAKTRSQLYHLDWPGVSDLKALNINLARRLKDADEMFRDLYNRGQQTASSTHPLLDANVDNDTATYTVKRGSLIVGNSTPAWDGLAVGGNHTVLKSNGTDPAWGAVTLTTDISGILPQANGGTGKDTSAATDGQILIGKTSDHSLNLATLTAGSNITITNGAGTVTVASSAVSQAQVLARVMLRN